jgi:hypothetical protein
MASKFKLAKVDPLFERKIREVALERIRNGVDKKLDTAQSSIRRYTRAMTRYEPLWEVLKKAEFKEEKK